MRELFTVPEQRAHIAKRIEFPPHFVPYINWQAIGDERRELACELSVTQRPDLGVIVTLYWPHSEEE